MRERLNEIPLFGMQRDDSVRLTGSYGDGVIQAQKEVTESKSSLSRILSRHALFFSGAQQISARDEDPL